MPSRPIAVRLLPGCRGHVPAAELRRVARDVLESEGVAREAGVEVVLADVATVRNLNRLYRGRDEPTDVLSFASHEGDAFVEAPDESPSLGEIVICLPVVLAQARDAAREVRGEVAHLLVHGLLHVLGYDHEASEADSRRMQEREDELLDALGYKGAYAHGH
jgi:probable rRNA maturation factor